MEEFRSKSCRDGGRMQHMDTYDENKSQAPPPPPPGMQDLRCYSANYAGYMGKEVKMKKVKSAKHHPNHYGSSSSKCWSIHDPELQRKKRVASYKVYAAEGKMKGSLRKSVKWIKNTYTQVVHGWW